MARTWIIALLIATRFRRTGRGLFPFLCSSSSCYWQKDFNTIEKEREREGEIVFCYPSELSKISKTNLLSRRGRAAASHWFVKVDIKGSIRISLSFFLCAFLNFFSLPPFIYSHAATLFFLYFVIDFVFFFHFKDDESTCIVWRNVGIGQGVSIGGAHCRSYTTCRQWGSLPSSPLSNVRCCCAFLRAPCRMPSSSVRPFTKRREGFGSRVESPRVPV